VHLTSTSCKRLATLATGNQSYKALFSFPFIDFDIFIWSAFAGLSCGTEYITAHSGVMGAIIMRRMTVGAEMDLPKGNGKIEQNSSFFYRLVETMLWRPDELHGIELAVLGQSGITDSMPLQFETQKLMQTWLG